MVNTQAALKRLWRDSMTVTEYQKFKESETRATKFEEVIVLYDQPCKLSFSTLQATNQNSTNASLVQVTKLFLDNAVEVKPGSKITVTRNGQVFDFKQSGLPGIFSSHQEIVLVPFDGWA